jgi:type I restriction enzyme S subunit
MESKTCHDPLKWEPAFRVRKGDFLISRANTQELVGACVIVRELSKRLMLSDKTLRIRFTDLNPSWALCWLRGSAGRSQIEELATGNQQSMRNISQKALRSIRIAVPSLDEQDEIVRLVEELYAFADRLDSRVATARKRVEALTQSILAKAFRGELVPTEAELAEAEGREYETAAMLLERVWAVANQRSAPRGAESANRKVRSVRASPVASKGKL